MQPGAAPSDGRRLQPWWSTAGADSIALVTFLLLLVSHERALLARLWPSGSVPLSDSAALPLACAGLALQLPACWRWHGLAALGVALAALFSFDRASLQYFQLPLGVDMLPAAGQLWDVRSSTAALVTPVELLLPASFLLFAGYGVLRARWPAARRPPVWAVRAVGLLLLLAATPPLSVAWARGPGQRPNILGHRPAVRAVRDHGLGVYHAWDLVDAWRRRARRGDLDPELAAHIGALLAHKQALNATPSPLAGVAAGRSVLFVQLEAFQGFLLGLKVDGGEVTPNLNRLAERSLAFPRCVDVTTVGRTSDAELAVLTGLLPHSRIQAAHQLASNRWVALPALLAERGYHTLLLHAYSPAFWNRALIHPSYGMADLRFQDAFDPGRRLALGLADEEFFAQTARMLADVPDPFFALAVSLSSHHPFDDVPAELAAWPVGEPQQGMAASYLRLAHYTDRALGQLLEALRARGLLEWLLLVVYGDHDAGLDPQAREDLRRWSGVDPGALAQNTVPLVLAVPGREALLVQQREALAHTWGALHDLAPTVLHLLGEEIPSGFLGTHLLVPAGRRDPLLVKGGGVLLDGTMRVLGEGRDDPDLARRVRAALAERILADAILEHDAQRLGPPSGAPAPDGGAPFEPSDPDLLAGGAGLGAAAALPDPTPAWVLPPAALGRALTATAVESEPPAPWRRRLHGEAPVPEGRVVLPSVPPEGSGCALRIRLENVAADARSCVLEGFDRFSGRVLRRELELPPGGSVELPIERMPRTTDRVLYATLQMEPGLSAESWVISVAGSIPQPVLDSTATHTQLSGATRGLAAVVLVLIHRSAEAGQVRLRVHADARLVSTRDFDLAPGEVVTELVPMPEGAEQVRLALDGSPVLAHCVRIDERGVPYR